MTATWLAAVFDIDPHDQPLRVLGIGALLIVPRRGLREACPDERIGRGRTRLWSAIPVIFLVAELEVVLRAQEVSVRLMLTVLVGAAGQAGALQCIEMALRSPRVERINHITRLALPLIVARVLPLATDTWIAQGICIAVLLRIRGTQLTAMSDLFQQQTSRRLSREQCRNLRDANYSIRSSPIGLVDANGEALDQRSTTGGAA